ncbi:MAG TPA: hypothetical protein VKB81_05705 [Nitrospira sp.]|nr:hypothetical protein [Nitrospira sp.]
MRSLAVVTFQAHAAAPITPSGLNTQVNLSQTPLPGKAQYDITGGTRPGGGLNLYHSFGNFNVPTNNIANFLNSGSVHLLETLLVLVCLRVASWIAPPGEPLQASSARFRPTEQAGLVMRISCS